MSETTAEQKAFAASIWKSIGTDRISDAYDEVVARDAAKDALIAKLKAANSAYLTVVTWDEQIPYHAFLAAEAALDSALDATHESAAREQRGMVEVVRLLGCEKIRADKAEAELKEMRENLNAMGDVYTPPQDWDYPGQGGPPPIEAYTKIDLSTI